MNKLFLSLGLFLSAQVFAQNNVRIGEPSFVGTGCNNRNSSASISADGQTLSVLFDDYIVEAGGNLRRQQDRKGCNVLIPIEVPRGFSVAVFKIDYRGFNSLPAGAESQFSVDYFFGGRVGPRSTQNFRGPLEDDFISNSSIESPRREWSPCGRPMVLRAHSVMKVQSNRRREQAMSIIDSADVQAAMTYHLQWRACTPR